LDVVIERFLGRSFGVVESYYEKVRGGPLPDALRVDYEHRLLEIFRGSLLPIPAIKSVLTQLTIPFCLASSSNDRRIEATLAVTGLDRFFAGRVFNAAMVKNGKPAPDMFLLAADTCHADPGRTLVVEDTSPGIIAAKAAGMEVWGFVGGSHFANDRVRQALVDAGPDRTFASMTELLPMIEHRQ